MGSGRSCGSCEHGWRTAIRPGFRNRLSNGFRRSHYGPAIKWPRIFLGLPSDFVLMISKNVAKGQVTRLVPLTLCVRTGEAMSAPPQSHDRLLACDETYITRQGRLDVSSSGGLQGGHLGGCRQYNTCRRSSQTVFLESPWCLSYSCPRVITVDKNATYPKAMRELKAAETLPQRCELRQVKYLNKLVEQDHRSMKRLVKTGLGFFSDHSAWRTLQGYETMNMIRKRIN